MSKLVQNSMLIGQLKNQLSLKKSLKLTEEKKTGTKGRRTPETRRTIRKENHIFKTMYSTVNVRNPNMFGFQTDHFCSVPITVRY